MTILTNLKRDKTVVMEFIDRHQAVNPRVSQRRDTRVLHRVDLSYDLLQMLNDITQEFTVILIYNVKLFCYF